MTTRPSRTVSLTLATTEIARITLWISDEHRRPALLGRHVTREDDMNLSTMLRQRAAGGRPVRIRLIGAGKFGSMVLAQAQRIAGFHVVGVADLDVGKARAALARVGWPAER